MASENRIDYTQLNFPLRAFVILRLHKDDIIDPNTSWESDDNILRVPYNYLRSFNFGTQIVDGGPGGTISILDPYIGEVTNFVTKLRQFSDNIVDVMWGWQDENEQIKPAGSGYVMALSKLELKFENGGILYDMEMVSYGIKELYVSKVDKNLMNGIFDGGKKVSPIGILRDIITNYNNTKKQTWPAFELQTNYRGGIDNLIKHEDKKLEGYPGDSKSIVQVAMDLIKSTKVDNNDLIHFRLIVSSNIEKMNNKIILFIKSESEETHYYNMPLNSLYENAMYFYNKNERGNVLNMDLNYENWIGMIGTSFQVGAVNKQTGKYEMVINDDNQNSNTYIPSGIGPLRPIPVKDNSQGGDDNPVLLNSQTAEAGILDNVQTPEATKKWINSMQSRLRAIQMNGSITVLGDPNIYDNIEHLDNKYIELAVYDNEQQIVPGYSSKYKVLAWEHNIDMGKWVTKISITSLYQEDNSVMERYKKNNFVER